MSPRIPKLISISSLPSFAKLGAQELGELAAFLRLPRPGGAGASNAPVRTSSPQRRSVADREERFDEVGIGASMIGDATHGALLFRRQCTSCHGLRGGGGVANPGSTRGVVPALNPIDRSLFSEAPWTFAEHIDRFVQHGATPPGAHPALRMFAFGDSSTLTQPEIAHLEAYILSFNGARRALPETGALAPRTFIMVVLCFFVGVGILLALFRFGAGQRK